MAVSDRDMRFELVPMRPHDHLGWVYSGMTEFGTLARSFLGHGASRGERLMLVAEDPEADVLAELSTEFEPDQLIMTRVSEVYGTSGVVDVASAYETLAARTEAALAAGYSGLRVVADNSSLVQTDEALDAWIGWELLADRFIAEGQMTALCAFDRSRVSIDTLRHVATLHPLSSADHPAPQFSLFAGEGCLCIEGEVDSFAVGYLQRALEVLPPDTSVVVDLSRANVRGNAARASLFNLAQAGIEVTLVGLGRSRTSHAGAPASG